MLESFQGALSPLIMLFLCIMAVYGGDTQTGAGMAMISHILCVVTIPVLYGLIKLYI